MSVNPVARGGHYDSLVDAYDRLWCPRWAESQQRLTTALRLVPGERLLDLACGNGVVTLEMAGHVAPGEVVGVDASAGMLEAARENARVARRRLTLVHGTAEDFVYRARSGSFDVVSMRFALDYVPWPEFLPCLARVIAPGGRVALLTSLAGSTPQLWTVYRKLMDSFGEVIFPSTVPDDLGPVCEALERGGLAIEHRLESPIRFWFGSGMEAAAWLRTTGYITHPSLTDEIALALEPIVGEGLEAFREAEGVPLDFILGTVIGVQL